MILLVNREDSNQTAPWKQSYKTGQEVIKKISCSTQLRMKFQMFYV